MTYARPQKRGNTINECIQLEEGPKFGGIKLLAERASCAAQKLPIKPFGPKATSAPRPYKPKRGVITAHY